MRVVSTHTHYSRGNVECAVHTPTAYTVPEHAPREQDFFGESRQRLPFPLLILAHRDAIKGHHLT